MYVGLKYIVMPNVCHSPDVCDIIQYWTISYQECSKYMGICNSGSMYGWELFHKVLVVEGGMAGEISHIYGMEKLTHNHLNWEVS